MNILDKVFRNKKHKTDNIFDLESLGLFYGSLGYNGRNALMLSTVYRCVSVVSESIASLPIEIYDTRTEEKYVSHPAYFLLNKEPSQLMSRFTFIKLIISQMLLNGAAYVYIRRKQGLNGELNGDIEELVYIPTDYVTVIHNPGEYMIPPTYSIVGFDRILEADEMLVFLNYSVDGINGISTLQNARMALNLSMNSERHCSNFFKSNANLNGILSVDGLLSSDQKRDIKRSWESTFNSGDNRSGIAVLEGNMKFQPVQINSKDQQMLETRMFNVIDICRFFNVNPVMVYDLTKGSYGTVEAMQLSFLNDLTPLITNLEMEFERKLFKKSEKSYCDVKFNLSDFLKADLTTKAEYYSKLFSIGTITPNEIRKELNYKKLEGGDKAYIQVNMQPINN